MRTMTGTCCSLNFAACVYTSINASATASTLAFYLVRAGPQPDLGRFLESNPPIAHQIFALLLADPMSSFARVNAHHGFVEVM